ncbi:MAG: putative manganese transporter [Bacteroidales bacterium]
MNIVHILKGVLLSTINITGLVLLMMMLIEYLNVQSSGLLSKDIKKSSFKQVLIGSILGILPGCPGGFATVSLYSHQMISFGALTAMMIATSGDESFVMLATMPRKALLLFGILFIIAMIVGLIIDKYFHVNIKSEQPDQKFEFHADHDEQLPSIFKLSSYNACKEFSIKRLTILIFLILYTISLLFGWIGDNKWINLIFSIISVFVILFTLNAKAHFINDHIWKHVILKHIPQIFAWTFGTLLVLEISLNFVDVGSWINNNLWIVMILAALIGLIPESGPHLIFVTLFVQGQIPIAILLASSISQDGHATLPLLASNRKSFLLAKSINVVVAIIFGSIGLLL